MAIAHKKILKEYLILCEGRDTENFLISYLNSEALKCDERFGENIQTFDFGGIKDLNVFMQNLRNMEGFERVEQILVIRDAETDVEKAENDIKKAFRDCGLAVPDGCFKWNVSDSTSPATAYILLPTCDSYPKTGALEDLCWDILSGEGTDALKTEVKTFVSKIKSNYEDSIGTHEHKSRLHAYFSIKDDYVSLKVGEAARVGAFDWSHDKLRPLKEIIEKGFYVNKLKTCLS